MRELASPAVASPAVRPREVPAVPVGVDGLEPAAADGAMVVEGLEGEGGVDPVEAVAADLAAAVVAAEDHLAGAKAGAKAAR